MPLIKNSTLPTFDRLKGDGWLVLDPERASHQDIRELHIGFLNLMPDAALEATERQFFRLIGESNSIAQIHVHPFTLPIIERGEAAAKHIAENYESFEKLKEEGLDALVVTGANTAVTPPISDQKFWQPMIDVLEWAKHNTTSTLCSCYATHVAMTYNYGQKPQRQNDKIWGVYRHRVMEPSHPIVRGMNTVFDVPHSRFNDVSRVQFEKAGMRVLVESKVGVHMAASTDGFRLICFQGHPEYDIFSLLKEYAREVENFKTGKRADYPPFPAQYFNDDCVKVAEAYQKEVQAGNKTKAFPEKEILPLLDNTWADSARSIMANWVGLVYQVTNMDRKKQFMDGIDPNDPLGLYTGSGAEAVSLRA